MANDTRNTQKLIGMTIVGGFLNGTSYDFADGLNCIIGARGTGKTSCLEFLRYCLDVMPRDKKANERLRHLVAANLRGGHIDVKVRTREGMEYVISRAVNTNLAGELEDTRPVVKDASGNATGIPFSDSFCRLDVFSQNEIEEIAVDRKAQLRLIDSFRQDELAALTAEIEQTKASINAINVAMTPDKQEMAVLEVGQDKLPEVEKRLAAIQDEGSMNTDIENAQAQKSMRTIESQMFRRLSDALKSFPMQLQHIASHLNSASQQFQSGDLDGSDNSDLVASMGKLFTDCEETVSEAFDSIAENIGNALGQFAEIGRELEARHDQGEVAYQETLEMDRQCRERAEERMELLNERQVLMASRRRLLSLRAGLEAKQAERRKLVGRLSSLYDRRSDIRRSIVQEINGRLCPNVRVTMNQFAERSEFMDALCDSMRSVHQCRYLSGLISKACFPSTLTDAVRSGNREAIAKAIGKDSDSEQITSVLGALNDDAVLARLESVELQDSVLLELLDGKKYKPSGELSTGQKCNAVLPILLMDSDRPLLIDQPEDNLDNGYVHEIIVKSVLDVKGHRQLVFVTHNPNIPVLGGAEGMLVLATEDGQAHRCASGTFMDCREYIIKLLEGGREAFERRKECYREA